MFSSLYHFYDEQNYEMLDVIFAVLTGLILAFLLIRIWKMYGTKSIRFLTPFIFGVLSLSVYFVNGSAYDHSDTQNIQYAIFHTMWHVLSSITATLIVIQSTQRKNEYKKNKIF